MHTHIDPDNLNGKSPKLLPDTNYFLLLTYYTHILTSIRKPKSNESGGVKQNT